MKSASTQCPSSTSPNALLSTAQSWSISSRFSSARAAKRASSAASWISWLCCHWLSLVVTGCHRFLSEMPRPTASKWWETNEKHMYDRCCWSFLWVPWNMVLHMWTKTIYLQHQTIWLRPYSEPRRYVPNETRNQSSPAMHQRLQMIVWVCIYIL